MTAQVFPLPPSFGALSPPPAPPFLSFIPSCQWVPCLTLINSKCKTHLSTAPLPPFSPSWGLGPGPSFLPSAEYHSSDLFSL